MESKIDQHRSGFDRFDIGRPRAVWIPIADQFVANASGTAEDANDRIIFETDTGKLFFDSNGSTAGGAAQFAKVSSDLELTASSFSII